MSQTHKNRVLVLLVVVVAVALLFPVLFGAAPTTTVRNGENNWRTFVYDFQTLITGILAVGAAYLTIRASHRFDKRQQTRHEQLYDLQIRPEKLRLDRAYKKFDVINGYGANLFKTTIPTFSSGFSNPSIDDINSLVSLIKRCEITLNYIRSEEMTAISEILDGRTHVELKALEYGVRTLQGHLTTLIIPDGNTVLVRDVDGASYKPVTETLRAEALKNAQIYMSVSRYNHQEFVLCFTALAKLYKII